MRGQPFQHVQQGSCHSRLAAAWGPGYEQPGLGAAQPPQAACSAMHLSTAVCVVVQVPGLGCLRTCELFKQAISLLVEKQD